MSEGETEQVLISKKEYYQLKCAQNELMLLESGGVDNWEWYSESLHPKGEESYSDYNDKLAKELGLT